MSRIAKEREAELAKVYTLPAGYEALVQLNYVRENYDCAINGYMNLLKLTQDTMYEGRSHFLLELIQNADDAQFDQGEAELTFIINNDSIELMYNEKGFDIQDVVAITDTGESTKINRKNSSHSYIGEKGVGFKSVFALASEVEIESHPWHFVLKKEKCIVPIPIPATEARQISGTRLCIRFSDTESIAKVNDVLQSMIDVNGIESFLFLQTITSFVVEDRRSNPPERNGIVLTPNDRKGESVQIHITDSDAVYEYALYHQTVKFSADLVKSRWEKVDTQGQPLERRFSVAALTANPEDYLPLGKLFCYLPTEVELPVPLYLQVDGHLMANREGLHDPKENPWNKYLLSLLPDFLVDAILHWRNHPVVRVKLPNYIPVSTGSDQLASVFENVMKKLQQQPWIRTYDDTWVSPQRAFMADEFLTDLFQEYGELRNKAEKILGKAFVHPEWSSNSKWGAVWNKYRVEKADVFEVIEILSALPLPDTYLRDDNKLLKLYGYLNANCKKSILGRTVKNKLLAAPIFPLEGNCFGSLQASDQIKQNIYYISGQSKREVGLDSLIEFKIINPEYTYHAKASGDASPARQAEVQRINARNDAVRSLLKALDIKEVDDETLLTEMQIPALLDEARASDDPTGEYRTNILSAIFEAYQSKRSKDPEYVEKLARIKSAELLTAAGKFATLAQMVLPGIVRLPDDELYANAGLPEFKLPANYEKTITDKTTKLPEQWRQFLIDCGICTKPSFTYYYMEYDNQHEFERDDYEYFSSWYYEIDGQVTHYRKVEKYYFKLDPATSRLLRKKNISTSLPELIYRAWIQHSNSSPTIGEYQVKYYYYKEYEKILKDSKWGGFKRSQIPLLTVNGEVSYSDLVRSITKEILQKSQQLAGCFSLVLESKTDNEGYSKQYLDSLHVKALTVRDINALWKKQDCEDATWRNSMLTIILDFVSTGLNYDGILIYDVEIKKLRPLTDFCLGKVSSQKKPLIELQYGEIGTKLGQKVGLPMEDEANEYIVLLQQMAASKFLNEAGIHEKIKSLLVKWKGFELKTRLKIKDSLHTSFGQNPPILLFNQAELLQLSHAGYKVANLDVSPNDVGLLAKASQDIGFLCIESIGEIDFANEMSLTSEESVSLTELFNYYVHEFDDNDWKELQKKCGDIGLNSDHSQWSGIIRKVSSGSRVIGHGNRRIEMQLTLPFTNNGLFMASREWANEEIAAQLIALIGLERFKSAHTQMKQFSQLIRKKEERSIRNGSTCSQGECENTTGDEGSNYQPKGVSLDDIAKVIAPDLTDNRKHNAESTESQIWRTFVDPAEEERRRIELEGNIRESLRRGPEVYVARLRKMMSKREDGVKKWIDPNRVEPRQFFEAEYDGRCQICSTHLLLSNGTKLIYTYHINESKEWWKDKPFNLLGLCPNCHALAKHSGGIDLKGIPDLAKEWVAGEIAPEEMTEFNGDYYPAYIKFNGTFKRMALSSNHLSWFAILFGAKEG